MQKKLIAMAVAGLVSGAAFAQSNVTIYGVADLTFDNVKSSGAAVSGNNLPQRNRVSGNSSYIGFKGAETLGNGLTAVFQFENGISPDSTGGTWANRDSFVGLAGGFGTVALGTLTGPTRGFGAAMDPNAGATGISVNAGLLGKLGGGAGASIFDTRWTNTIAYISPTFGGMSITAAYVANENKSRDGLSGVPTTVAYNGAVPTVTGGQLNTWGYDLGFKYDQGPIMAAITQNQVRVGDTAGIKLTDTRGGAKFKMDAFSIGLMLDRVKLEAAGSTAKRNAWFVPASFTMGQIAIVGQYGRAGAVTDVNDSKAKMYSIGAEYSLSKRTMIKANYAQISNDANANYDFGVNSVGANTAAAGPAAGADPKGFQVGIRHTF